MSRRLSRLALVLCATLAASPALAAPRNQAAPGSAAPGPGNQMLTVWGVFDPGPIDGLGVGVRFMFPVAPGVIQHSTVRDEFTLEVGGDFVHYHDRVGVPGGPYVSYDWNGILPVAGGTWNFWLNPKFALYPKIELGYWAGWYSGWNNNFGGTRGDFGGLYLAGAIGAIVRLQTVSLRAEAGSGFLRLGAGFHF